MARSSTLRPSKPSLAMVIPLLAILFASTASAASAVLGIDLGTNFIKAVIVKPGTPLDIVLTKDSKRKEAGVVAFKPASKPVELGHFPERLYGGDALALGGRFPGEVYTHLKPLVGASPADTDNYKHEHPAINIQSAAPGSVIKIKSDAFSSKEQPWTVEELLAMQLKNIRANAETMTGRGSKITDAVITVPSFLTANERRSIMRAASLAGLDVMALVTDGLAVGIDYAVKRDFPNVSKGAKPELHMVLDVGAASTVATILRFQGKQVKDVGRFNKTVQEVAVVGNGWDRTLGGNAMNGLIVDHMLAAFMKKSDVSSQNIAEEDIRKHPRAAAKLYKEAERARQVLSANTEVRSSFEGLYDDIDFSVKLTRTEFEDMAKAYAERVDTVVKKALDSASVSLKDLNSIILYGGAVRMPLVQKQVEKLVGKDCEIRSNVNADESAAFGAAFKAAGLSPSFRVKEIRDSDAAVYEAGILQTVDGKQKKQQVWKETSLNGPSKHLSFKQKDDFDFVIYQTTNGLDQSLVEVKTTNLTQSVASLEALGCSKADIATKFALRLGSISGVPDIASGTVSCEIVPAAKAGGLGDSVKGMFGFGGSKDQEPLKDNDKSAKSDSKSSSKSPSSSSASASASAKASVPKKRIEVVNIAFTSTPVDTAAPSKEDLARMTERLAAFDRADKARLQREEALNVLEAFTYKARDLLEDVGFQESSTEAVRSELSTLLGTTSEWLYGEGVQAATDVFNSKLADLKKLVNPVQKRIDEARNRPDKLKSLEASLDQTKSLIKGMNEQIELAASAASSAAAEAAASATATKSESEATPSTDLDDLEEADTSSTSTSSAAKETEVFKAAYSQDDVSEIQKLYDSMTAWVKEKTDAQAKLLPNQDPAVTVKDIEAKAAELSRVTMRLLQKKMQIPKKSKSSKKATKSASAKSASAKSASASSGDASKATNDLKGKIIQPGIVEYDLDDFNGADGKMPTDEEIRNMVEKLQAKESSVKSGIKSEAPEHGEL